MSATSIFNRLQNVLPTSKGAGKPLLSLSSAGSIGSQRQMQALKAKEVLTLEEAGQLLRVDPQVLLLEVTKGTIPGCHLGEEWRFSATALIGILSSCLPEDSVNLELVPDSDWEYSGAWITCIEIRQLIREIQEMMLSGQSIHDLVAASSYEQLCKVLRQFYRQTETREEDLQYQYFREIGEWKKRAQAHYWEYKLSLGTWVTGNSPQYKLLFENLSTGAMVTHSDELPVQTEWTPLEEFWIDSRRYDIAYFKTPEVS